MVRLVMRDPGDGSLISELQNGALPAAAALKGHAAPVRFLARVAAVNGSAVALDRPLPIKVRH
jgi:hypothetical protein